MYDCLDDCVVILWSSSDGEQYVGDQEYVEDPSSPEHFDQGKYSMDHPCCLFTLITKFMMHVSTLATLVFIPSFWSLDPCYLWDCIWVVMLVLWWVMILWTWIIDYGIKVKRCFLATWTKDLSVSMTPGLTAQPWGLYGSGFSQVGSYFLPCY